MYSDSIIGPIQMVEEALLAGSIAAVVVLLPVTFAILRTPFDDLSGVSSNPVPNGHGGVHVGGPEFLQGVASSAFTVGRRSTQTARNENVWLGATAVTVLLVAVVNLLFFGLVSVSFSLGVIPIAIVFALAVLVTITGVYSVVSAWSEGNAMPIAASAIAFGLVALVAISGHVLLFGGFEGT